MNTNIYFKKDRKYIRKLAALIVIINKDIYTYMVIKNGRV